MTTTIVQTPYLSTEEAAEYLRIKPKTLKNWRSLAKGPKGVHVGKKVVYRRADLDRFVDQAERQSL